KPATQSLGLRCLLAGVDARCDVRSAEPSLRNATAQSRSASALPSARGIRCWWLPARAAMARRPEILRDGMKRGRRVSNEGDMAWKNLARLSGRQMKLMFRKWRLPPLPDDPRGVPRRVMRRLAEERLPSDVAVFNERLQQLLRE